MREQNTKVPYFDIICTLCWSCWIETGGGGSKPTPRQKCSVTRVGVIFNQWGVKPPNHPTNRTLVGTTRTMKQEDRLS